MNLIKLCVISDTHLMQEEATIPECDILLCCGDFSKRGYESYVRHFGKWLNSTPSKERVVVCGNHERLFMSLYPNSENWLTDECENCHVLKDDTITIKGITIYGCFYHIYQNCGNSVEDIVNKIKNVDVVMCHEPCYGIMDDWPYEDHMGHIGDKRMREAIIECKTKLYCHGHSHSCYGASHFHDTLVLNAALSSEDKTHLANLPIELTYNGNNFELMSPLEVKEIDSEQKVLGKQHRKHKKRCVIN